MHIFQNICIFFGIYTIITEIWQGYELITNKEIKPSKRDTNIALIMTFIIFYFCKV